VINTNLVLIIEQYYLTIVTPVVCILDNMVIVSDACFPS